MELRPHSDVSNLVQQRVRQPVEKEVCYLSVCAEAIAHLPACDIGRTLLGLIYEMERASDRAEGLLHNQGSSGNPAEVAERRGRPQWLRPAKGAPPQAP